MKTRDLMVVGLSALATLTVCQLLPSPVGDARARPDEFRVTASSTPTLETDGAELSLRTDKPVYRPGDKPVVTLTAVNHTDRRLSLKVNARMLTMSPASRFSRMAAMPIQLWNQDCLVELKPGETRNYTYETRAAVQAGKAGYFSIQAGNRTVTVAHFSAPLPGAQGDRHEGLANQLGRGAGPVAGRAAGDRS